MKGNPNFTHRLAGFTGFHELLVTARQEKVAEEVSNKISVSVYISK
jgi:hypothetical protein